MNSQDIARIGYRAKRETEAFINTYLNDRAKGWPVLCRCGSACNGYQQENAGRLGILHTLQTN